MKSYLAAVGAAALTACALFPKEKPVTRQECPEGALGAMKSLGVEVGQQGSLSIDAQQPGGSNEYGSYRPGSLVSRVVSGVGGLPEGTLLSGRLWMDGGRVHAHYAQAQLPEGQQVPVCLVLGSSAPGGLFPEAGSTPGAPTLPRSAPFTVVDHFEP